MSITKHTTRHGRMAVVTTLAAGAGLVSLLGMGGVAAASTHVNGWVPVDVCTSVSGTITYTPGLRTSALKKVNAVLTGTIAGCSNINGPQSGTGTFTAIMSGTASKDAENFTSGTFTINWPVSFGFNPFNGTLGVTESNGLETVAGDVSINGGKLPLTLQYVITGSKGTGTKKHPVTSQTYTNTQSLEVLENTG